jgi:flagellar basal-body rod modification protein FlgD
MTTTTATSGATSANSSNSTASNIAAGQKTLSTNFQTFLTLLTTQLKNQDPTSPLDPNQFTQQLVQMTGVQQQLISNQLLQQIADSSSGGQGVLSGVGLIGKNVTATDATATLSGGRIPWSYSLGSTASQATLTITNTAGQTVYSANAPSLTAGVHGFTWNGKDSSGNQLPNGGQYTLKISATDANGANVTSQAVITGQATGVAQDASGAATILIGSTAVPLSAVTSVSN